MSFDPSEAREADGLLLHPCDRCEGSGYVPNEPEMSAVALHPSVAVPVTAPCPTCGGTGEREADMLATALIKLTRAMSGAIQGRGPEPLSMTVCEVMDLISDAREQVRLRHPDDLWEPRRKAVRAPAKCGDAGEGGHPPYRCGAWCTHLDDEPTPKTPARVCERVGGGA